jgi:hypothetical protein
MDGQRREEVPMTARRKIDYDSLVKTDRVHSSVYTDPEIFAEELDAIFHRGWVYVGHAGEIPNRGDYRLKRIGRYPVIMVRGDDGQIRLPPSRGHRMPNRVRQCGNFPMRLSCVDLSQHRPTHRRDL